VLNLRLPTPNLAARFIETVRSSQPKSFRDVSDEQLPQRLVLIEEFQILGLIGRRGRIVPNKKNEPDYRCIKLASSPFVAPGGHKNILQLRPGDIHVNVLKVGVRQRWLRYAQWCPLGGATKRPKPMWTPDMVLVRVPRKTALISLRYAGRISSSNVLCK